MYIRSPVAFLDDSIFSPPLLPQDGDEPANRVRLPTRYFHNLRECGDPCALHRGDQFGFLLVGAAVGLAADFLARADFAGLAFWALRSRFGLGAVGSGLLPPFTESTVFSLMLFSLPRFAVVTSIGLVRRNGNENI